MADLSAAIATTTEMDSPFGFVTEFVVKSGATIYQGSGVAIGSDGYIVHSSQAGALYTLGRAEQTVVGDGTLRCRVKMGVMRFANDGAHLLSIANRLGPCYWTDDQTVGTDSSKLLAGVVIDADASWAYVLMGATMPGSVSVGALLAANNLNDVASAATSRTNLGLGTGNSPTFTGLTLTGAAAVAGNITSLRKTAVKTATYTVVNATDGDALFQDATDNAVITLPDAAAGNAGQEVVIQNTAADGAAKLSISPDSSDKIAGGIGSVYSGAVANKDWINTKATQKKGDYVRLRSDGVDTWWIVGGIGVWASEP